MGQAPRLRSRIGVQAVRAWPMWELPRPVVAYIAVIVSIYGAALAVTATTVSVSPHILVVFVAMLVCGAATVELTRRAGDPAGLSSDIYAVWELPVAILLPPLFALVAPVLRIGLSQWRVRRTPTHRRVFTAAAVGLSYGTASVVFHQVSHGLGLVPNPGLHGSLWVLMVALAAVVQWAVNLGLVLPAIKGADPAARLRQVVLTREIAQNDIAELSVAVLVTFAVAISPLTLLFALPFVTLLQRSSRHIQLLNASRLDSKTSLLNAGTWEREAAVEVARAVRTRSALAVALIDLDHFKVINDAHGHLAGDKALQTVARIFKIFVREYDLVGRFGGEEFALLLPQTRAVDAYRIAERIREHIAATPIVGTDPHGQPIRLTVSIGVAALGASWDRSTSSQLTDLVAAADRALYQAKRSGRDQVCMITDVSAPSPEPAPASPTAA